MAAIFAEDASRRSADLCFCLEPAGSDAPPQASQAVSARVACKGFRACHHSTTSSKDNLARRSNSLSWSATTLELRVKFINAVGVCDLWHTMTLEQKSALINLINAEREAHKAIRVAW